MSLSHKDSGAIPRRQLHPRDQKPNPLGSGYGKWMARGLRGLVESDNRTENTTWASHAKTRDVDTTPSGSSQGRQRRKWTPCVPLRVRVQVSHRHRRWPTCGRARTHACTWTELWMHARQSTASWNRGAAAVSWLGAAGWRVGVLALVERGRLQLSLILTMGPVDRANKVRRRRTAAIIGGPPFIMGASWGHHGTLSVCPWFVPGFWGCLSPSQPGPETTPNRRNRQHLGTLNHAISILGNRALWPLFLLIPITGVALLNIGDVLQSLGWYIQFAAALHATDRDLVRGR